MSAVPLDPDWRPTATLEVLRQRSQLLDCVRRYFLERRYWEVETPLLSRDTCVDPWIHPLRVPDAVGAGNHGYLQTSPEFAHKRLLAAGADAIFEITRSFRRGEAGPRHNLEFTIVEWYRAGDTYQQQMTVVEDLIRAVAACPVHEPSPPLPAGAFPRWTYDDAARASLGTSLLDRGTADLRRLALDLGISHPASLAADDRDGWLNLLLAERIEPWLAREPACFVCDYPASQAALAQVRAGDIDVAERFELYLGGLELCNGYQELTDADELERRMRHNNQARLASGEAALPTDSRLLAAMRAGLPPCAGVALGFDRLVMWRLGRTQLSDVRAFPSERA